MSEENKSPAPTKEGLEERAEKWAQDHCRSCNDRSSYAGCTCRKLEEAYIAGAQSSLHEKVPDEFVSRVRRETGAGKGLCEEAIYFCGQKLELCIEYIRKHGSKF